MKQLAADTTQCCHCGSNSLLLQINILVFPFAHLDSLIAIMCQSGFHCGGHLHRGSEWYGCRSSTYRLLLPRCTKSGQEENLPKEVGWRSAGLQQHSVCGYRAAGVQRGSCHSHFRAVEHIKPIIITWSTAHSSSSTTYRVGPKRRLRHLQGNGKVSRFNKFSNWSFRSVHRTREVTNRC